MSRRVIWPVLGRLAVVLLAVVLVAGCSDEDADGEGGSDAAAEQEGNETDEPDAQGSDAGSSQAEDAEDTGSGDADAPVSTVTTTTTEATTTTATTTTTEPPATTTTAGVRTTARPVTTRAPATTQPPATTTTAAATTSTTTTTSTTSTTTTTTEAPPRELWSATLTVGYEADYFAGSSALGYGHGSIGVLDPVGFEHPPGNAVTVSSLLLYPDDSDRLYVTASGGLEGLWVKAAGHLAVEVGASQGKTAADDDLWNFDIPEGSLLWESGDTVEVSIWDKQPPLSEPPPRQLWTATMGAAAGGYGNLGDGVGYGRNRAGTLSPDSYLSGHPSTSGTASGIGRIVLLDDTDRLYFSITDSAHAQAFEGLWLKVADHLAFEIGVSTHEHGDKWFFDVAESALVWAAGADYEVSLWDKQPPLSEPPRRLWTSSLTVGSLQHGGSDFLGFVAGGEGGLDPWSYEHAEGSSLTLDSFGYYPDDDTFLVSVLSGDPNGLNGLWLKLGDDLAFEMDAATRSASGRDRTWSFALDWSSGDSMEVSLWDSQPPGTAPPPQKLWTSSMTVGSLQHGGNAFLGFVAGGEGVLNPWRYEHAEGSSLTLDSLGSYPDDDTFLVSVLSGDPNGLNGLWLKLGDDLALEMDAATRSGSGRDRTWSLADGIPDWSNGDSMEVSLWTKDPTGG